MRKRSLDAALALGFGVLTITTISGNASADQEKTVQWNEQWPRVRAIEAVNVVALTVGSILVHSMQASDHARWDSPILFDRAARSLFQLRTAGGQRNVATVSDLIYRGMVLAPYVIDNYITALGVHQNADVALQMTLINMQSLGISGVVTLATERFTGRARPYVSDCPPSGDGPTPIGFNVCSRGGFNRGGSDDYQSFYSGHAAAAFTMAGLTCAHHQHLPLYGGGVPDAMACFVMVSLATMTGVARMMSDRHWASDVIAGAGFGIFSGYVLPVWLHYGFGSTNSKSKSKSTPDDGSGKGIRRIGTMPAIQTDWGVVAPVPQLYPGGAGIGVVVL